MSTGPTTTASGSTTLYFGPWYRRSPFFEATLRDGCTAYDIYNHMYLPGYFADPIEEYRALVNGVVIFDVGVERTVQVQGPDADRLIDRSGRSPTRCGRRAWSATSATSGCRSGWRTRAPSSTSSRSADT